MSTTRRNKNPHAEIHAAMHGDTRIQDPLTARQAASRQYPPQFLCNLAYSVLDNKIGDLLDYQHFMKHPKYKDVWTKSFGTEIRHLATKTKTIFFIKKGDIPKDRKKDKTYARIVCVFCDGKKDKYRT
jgi:hypothetical protein